MVPLPGGWSGETFLATAAGERSVVRIYAERGARRGPAAVEVDAAVLRLVRGLLPVPEVLEVRRPDPLTGTPALLVTSEMPGERLEDLLPRLDAAERERVGRSVGLLAARLAGMPLPVPGVFVDGDLRVERFGPAADLARWVDHLAVGTALEQWPAADLAGLRRVADTAQAVLDGVDRTCLVHSDLNPKNVLVDPAGLEVTALLDWEFAHAGLPGEDLGNLLRFDRDPAFAGGVLTAYAAHTGEPPETALDTARAADLFALVELASRRGENPVTEDAHRLLAAVVATADLHARP